MAGINSIKLTFCGCAAHLVFFDPFARPPLAAISRRRFEHPETEHSLVALRFITPPPS
jgi:hypothetical protein